jgi:hypothetical protein
MFLDRNEVPDGHISSYDINHVFVRLCDAKGASMRRQKMWRSTGARAPVGSIWKRCGVENMIGMISSLART